MKRDGFLPGNKILGIMNAMHDESDGPFRAASRHVEMRLEGGEMRQVMDKGDGIFP